MVQTFFGGFTDVYGDKNISADKRTLISFFLSHSRSKKHSGSSLTVHRELRKYAGLALNQLTTKYPSRYFNLSHNVHGSNFTRHHY